MAVGRNLDPIEGDADPLARNDASLVALNGKVVLFGGYSAGVPERRSE